MGGGYLTVKLQIMIDLTRRMSCLLPGDEAPVRLGIGNQGRTMVTGQPASTAGVAVARGEAQCSVTGSPPGRSAG